MAEDWKWESWGGGCVIRLTVENAPMENNGGKKHKGGTLEQLSNQSNGVLVVLN